MTHKKECSRKHPLEDATPEETPHEGFLIAGIGASAGGMPADKYPGMA